MTDEEFKKLVKEYQEGLNQVEEVKKEYNEKYENLSEEEFINEFSNQLNEVLEDAKKNAVKKQEVNEINEKLAEDYRQKNAIPNLLYHIMNIIPIYVQVTSIENVNNKQI